VTNFFADKDVCSIALEVPNSALGATELRLWARTLVPGHGGGWVQAERGARPAQAVLLVEERGAYLAGEPADDGVFLPPSRTLWSIRVDIAAEAKRVPPARMLRATLAPVLLRPTRPGVLSDNGAEPSLTMLVRYFYAYFHKMGR